MKKTSKVLALVLMLVLVFSCVGTEAFAASAGNVKKYNSMVVLGDSIMRGCGLPGYDSYSSTGPLTGLPGSAPYLVAQECLNEGARRCFCTFQGETLASILCMLGLESESSDDFLWNPNTNYNWFARNIFPRMKEFCGSGSAYDVKENLKTAELIVIELGMGDVFYRSKEVSGLAGAFDGDGDLGEALLIMGNEMLNGCSYVMTNYTKLLDFIKKNNPNADVVIVSLYNMFAGLSPVDGMYLPVFDAEAIVSGSVNVFLKNIAKQYGYMYADISQVPTPIIEKNLALTNMGDMNAAVHPTVETGLPYMARQIINVLPSASAEASGTKGKIVVDLGFVDDVDYVMVDGLKIKNFTLKGNILTVPYLLPTAKTVTVAAVDASGKITLQLYGLSYNLKTGYSAYRLLSNSDVVGTVVNGANTVTNLLGGLFKK